MLTKGNFIAYAAITSMMSIRKVHADFENKIGTKCTVLGAQECNGNASNRVNCTVNTTDGSYIWQQPYFLDDNAVPWNCASGYRCIVQNTQAVCVKGEPPNRNKGWSCTDPGQYTCDDNGLDYYSCQDGKYHYEGPCEAGLKCNPGDTSERRKFVNWNDPLRDQQGLCR